MRCAAPILACLALTVLFGGNPTNSQNSVRTAQSNHPFSSPGCAGGNDRAFLQRLDRILRKDISSYDEFPSMGFFVYDLTDPSSSYISAPRGNKEQGCVTFKEGHVYHFSTLELATSKSQIAFIEDGKLKVFNSINCKDGKAGLEGVLKYATEKLHDKNKEDTITRLKHYRRYGTYRTVDTTEYRCRDETITPNTDKLYSRPAVLSRLSSVLRESLSEIGQRNYPDFLVESERAVGFFIYDLTEPSNKQTSLLERIEFKNGHVYHFADIDLPFSFSNIAILEDGNVRIFKAINCAGKGDSLEDVIRYLNEKLKADKDKDEIIRRVSNYRTYGVYGSLNGLSTPQCKLVRTQP